MQYNQVERRIGSSIFPQNIGQMRETAIPMINGRKILGACDTTVFLGCTDMLTATYFSERIGVASVEVESEARELNSMRITELYASVS